MLHAYRLLVRECPQASDSLWEWHQPWIDHLLWQARRVGCQVIQGYFATWQELAAANAAIWATTYAPLPQFAPWPTWHGWLIEYRELLAMTQDPAHAYHGQSA